MARRRSEILERLLAEAGPDFELDPSTRLSRKHPWSWRTLAHVLWFASSRVVQGDASGAASYLASVFGDSQNFELARLDPLGRAALAEIFNVWGVALRRDHHLDEAIARFDAALQTTDQPAIRHDALYNRGQTEVEIALDMVGGIRLHDDLGPLARIDRAGVDLRGALELDATDAWAWAWMGMASLLRASAIGLSVRQRIVDSHQAVAAFESAHEHEHEHEMRELLQTNLERARRSVTTLESLNWATRRFLRSKRVEPVPFTFLARDRMAAVPRREPPIRLLPGSAGAPVSLAPGCGVWIHARRRAILCLLAEGAPPALPGRSTPIGVLDLSGGAIDTQTCSTIATHLGLKHDDVLRLHELGGDAVRVLNERGWRLQANFVPNSSRALRLYPAGAMTHILVGPTVGEAEIQATPADFNHIVGCISPAAVCPETRNDTFARLVGANVQIWTLAHCAEAPLVVAARMLGVSVSVVDER